MAYVRRSPEEEALLQQQQTGAAPASAAAPVGAQSSAAAPGAAPQAAGPAKGSGYTSLQSYLGANAGGAKSLADGLAGTVDYDGRRVAMGIQHATDVFEGQRRAGTPIFTGTGSAAEAQARAAQGYAGPDGLDVTSNFTGLEGAAQRYGDSAKAINTWEGRQTALQDAYGKQGGYGLGAQGLDNFLATQAGGGRYGELAKKYGGLSQQYSQARDTATSRAGDARAQAAHAQGQWAEYAQAQGAREAAVLAAEEAQRAEHEARKGARRAKEARGNPKEDPYDGTEGAGREYARGHAVPFGSDTYGARSRDVGSVPYKEEEVSDTPPPPEKPPEKPPEDESAIEKAKRTWDTLRGIWG